ncbi:hypothetical protein BGW38_002599 [Lunasporangiospora selenospora]|uniref:Uncharacterized protein n=1 Tax=Lunasporangiospora selenospora TaxID=979761 RepID=A0A9P6FSI9_9FUNG|nr:hypothetical protein BGW38_002599 [Lunasporangiospora selenospora]
MKMCLSISNDAMKGFVTLSGSFIAKGELTIKLPKIPVVKATIHAQVPSDTYANTPTTLVSEGAKSGDHSMEVGSKTDHDSQHGLTPSTTATRSASQSSNGTPEDETADAVQQSSSTPQAAAASGTVNLPPVPLPQTAIGTHQLLHSYRPPGHLTQPYFLEQLRDVQNHTVEALHRLEDYWPFVEEMHVPDTLPADPCVHPASATKLEENQKMARLIKVQDAARSLRTLLDLITHHLRASIEAMAQPSKEKLYPYRVCDPKIFSPALSEDFVIEFYIRESQLVCAAYALHLTGSGGLASGANSHGGPGGSGGLVNYIQQALPGGSSPVVTTGTPVLSRTVSLASHTPLSINLAEGSDGKGSGVSTAAHGEVVPGSHSPAVTLSSTGESVGEAHHSALPQLPQQPPMAHAQHHLHGGLAAAGPPIPSTSVPSLPHSASQPPLYPRSSSSGQVHTTGAHSGVGELGSGETVVLPSSSKVGQTSKGGINKYRGKIATTLEDKMIQVESSKLNEISSRLVFAQNLCQRLLHFLDVQESIAPFSSLGATVSKSSTASTHGAATAF